MPIDIDDGRRAVVRFLDGRVLKGKRGYKLCSPKHRPGGQRTDGGES